MKSKIILLLVACGITVAMSITAFAGQWRQDTEGWWYDFGDGTWPANQWVWIDGNQDGVAESYWFGQDGYCLSDTTTPDGFTVDINGAWVQNGQVQTSTVSSADSSTIVINTGEFTLRLPAYWAGHYTIEYSAVGTNIIYAPLNQEKPEYPEYLFSVFRYQTLSAAKEYMGYVDNAIDLGYHNGAYYVMSRPTDTALEFYMVADVDLCTQMSRDYNWIASNVTFED